MTAVETLGELFAGPQARDHMGEPVPIGEHMLQAYGPHLRLPFLPRGRGAALAEHPPCCSLLAARALTGPDGSSGTSGASTLEAWLVSVISVVLLAFLQGIQPWASIPGSPYKCNRDPTT